MAELVRSRLARPVQSPMTNSGAREHNMRLTSGAAVLTAAFGLVCCAEPISSHLDPAIAEITLFTGTGEICLDMDSDADGATNGDPDNCPLTPNPGQEDVDGDALGDDCDANPGTGDGRGYRSGEEMLGEAWEKVAADLAAVDDGTVKVLSGRLVLVCRNADVGPFAVDFAYVVAALVDIAGGSGTGTVYAWTPVDLYGESRTLLFVDRDSKFTAAHPNGGEAIGDHIAFYGMSAPPEDSHDFDTAIRIQVPGHWGRPDATHAGLLVRQKAWFEEEEDPGAAPCDETIASPLVLDLDGDGILLSDLRVGFDLSGRGRFDLVSWLRGDDDRLLAIDLDGDGLITSGVELFGNASPLGASREIMATCAATGCGAEDVARAPNGFEALAAYDVDGDNEITAADPVYGDLLLWGDVNGDGVSQLDELAGLATIGVEAISLSYMSAQEIDEFGNETRQRATFRRGTDRHLIADVWLRRIDLSGVLEE